MLFRSDAAAHDGQVGVAAHEIVGEQAHEVQQLAEGGALDLHGGVQIIEHDAVLVHRQTRFPRLRGGWRNGNNAARAAHRALQSNHCRTRYP